MSRTGGDVQTPRAVIHKRILDAAESNPDASMEEIAASIAGASTGLVERVLEQYGDPAEDLRESRTDAGGRGDQDVHMDRQEHPDGQENRNEAEPSDSPDGQEGRNEREGDGPTPGVSDPDTGSDENGRSDVDHSELTERQLKTLRLIERVPNASQSDLADEFDVTRVTISRWLNDIPGFDWTRREEIASEILTGGDVREVGEQGGTEHSGGSAEPAESERSAEADGSGNSGAPGGSGDLERLHRRLDALERRIDQIDQVEPNPEAESPGIGPELAHKVVHASMKSDLITEEEELRLLRELMD